MNIYPEKGYVSKGQFSFQPGTIGYMLVFKGVIVFDPPMATDNSLIFIVIPSLKEVLNKHPASPSNPTNPATPLIQRHAAGILESKSGGSLKGVSWQVSWWPPLTGVIILQTQTMHYKGKFSNLPPAFALFDPPFQRQKTRKKFNTKSFTNQSVGEGWIHMDLSYSEILNCRSWEEGVLVGRFYLVSRGILLGYAQAASNFSPGRWPKIAA